jgi:hypothetical protein
MYNKKERAKDLRLRREYGITLEEYNKILKFQDYKCAICKQLASKFKTSLALDHSHLSGLLRGLCCVACNRALGRFRDNDELVNNAASYVNNPPITAVFGYPRFTVPGRIGTKVRAKKLKKLQLERNI